MSHPLSMSCSREPSWVPALPAAQSGPVLWVMFGHHGSTNCRCSARCASAGASGPSSLDLMLALSLSGHAAPQPLRAMLLLPALGTRSEVQPQASC